MAVTLCSLGSRLTLAQLCAHRLSLFLLTIFLTMVGGSFDVPSRAFDIVEWSELFTSSVRKKVHPIFLRILLFIYREQQCNVNWAARCSQRFSVAKGVRQGAVSSPLLFFNYIDEIFWILWRESLS